MWDEKDNKENIYCSKCNQSMTATFHNSNEHLCNEPTTPTKIFKITLMVADHDKCGIDDIKQIIENQKYPNWCISPNVIDWEERIVDWSDNHPLNKTNIFVDTFNKLFNIIKDIDCGDCGQITDKPVYFMGTSARCPDCHDKRMKKE